MQSILLRHLEANAHAIVVIHNAAHGTHRSAAGKIQLAQGLDVVEKIQNCETMRGDRPKEDISMEIFIIEE